MIVDLDRIELSFFLALHLFLYHVFHFCLLPTLLVEHPFHPEALARVFVLIVHFG